MPKFITVPMHVDALVLDQMRAVVGPEADVARAPWFGLDSKGVNRDHQPQTANVAAAIRHDPMTPHSRFLQRGVHLHWALPDRLTRGSTDNPNNAAFVERDGLGGPQAPNRWLVARASPKGAVDAAWFVESDVVHAWGTGHDAVAYPVTPDNWPYPYARVGRITQVIGDINLATTSRTTLKSLDAPLTAVGPNDPTFAALYPACHSIFGAHDPEPLAAGTYSVLGWYDAGAVDPLRHWAKPEGRSKAMLAQVLGSVIDEPADKPTPDSITDLAAAVKQSQDILLEHRTGWGLPQGDPVAADADGLLFFGSIDVQGKRPSTVPEPVTATVSVGSSPREAVSTLLAFDHDDPQLETELEAVAYGLELADHDLDVISKLREFRHSGGFHPTGQKTLWEFRPTDAQSPLTGSAAVADRPLQTASPLPLELAHLLNHLNLAQDRLGEAEDKLEWSRQQVFADWQLYMLAAYPRDDEANFPVDIDTLRDVVLPEAMQKCRDDMIAVSIGTTDLITQHSAALAALLQHNTTSAGADLELVASSGPRYWRPNDPSLAIDHAEALVPTRRHAQDHRSRVDGKLACLVLDLPAISSLASFAEIGEIMAVLRERSRARENRAFAAIAHTATHERVWNPILVEWQGTVAPALEGSNQRAGSGAFDPDVISKGFVLGEQACDLHPVGGLGDLGLARHVSGRSLLTGHGPDMVLARVKDYLDRVQEDIDAETAEIATLDSEIVDIDAALADATTTTVAKRALRDRKRTAGSYRAELLQAIADLEILHHKFDTLGADLDARNGLGSETNIVTFTLGGVMDRLLMLRSEAQLPIADPLGFPADQEVARQVRELTEGASELFTPEPQAPFLPLTTAELSLFDGRIIDTFGQFVMWHPQGDPATGRKVIAAETMRDPQGGAMLLPRSAQPARLNFRWLSARQNDVESNDHPAASPLCGWIVPNDADQSAMFYDAAGELLGTVDEHQRWHPAPGDATAPRGPGLIDNRHLRRIAQWMVTRSDPDFLQRFLAVADSALQQIEPYEAATHGSRALLVGRPIAVARAQVSLSLQGRPATDSSFAALSLRIDGHDPGDHGFGAIKYPIRIGEHGQFNDGLVGYFVDTGQEISHDVLFAPQSEVLVGTLATTASAAHGHVVKAAKRGSKTASSFEIYDETTGVPINLQRSFDDDPVQLTMLLDPRCPVHATCGILPTKSIRIPRDQYEPSMNDLKLMFSAMPVLTGGDEVDLPLPNEPDHRWSWVAIENGAWSETPSAPIVLLDDLRTALPGRVSVAADGSINVLAAGQAAPVDETEWSKADLLWRKLIADEWLTSTEPGRAQIGTTGTTELGATLPAEQIAMLLSTIARGISRAERTAVLRPRAVAREGWLQLTPTPTRHPDEIPDQPLPPAAAPEQP